MVKTIHAIYEHGVLRPLESDGIEENLEVTVTVSTEKEVLPPLLRFADIFSEEDANCMMKVVDDEICRYNMV